MRVIEGKVESNYFEIRTSGNATHGFELLPKVYWVTDAAPNAFHRFMLWIVFGWKYRIRQPLTNFAVDKQNESKS